MFQDDDEEFSETDIEAITEIANLPDPFRYVVIHDYNTTWISKWLLVELTR